MKDEAGVILFFSFLLNTSNYLSITSSNSAVEF